MNIHTIATIVTLLTTLACVPPASECMGECAESIDTEGTESSGDGDGDQTGPGDGDGEPTTDTTGDGDDTGDGDGDGDGEPECGNAVLEPGEQCDDGNLLTGDGCSPVCVLEPDAIPCGDSIYECGDGVDNDNDGKTDMADSNCTSPCDDDENSLLTLPGQDGDCEKDCFWNNGADACSWNLTCDPDSPGADIGCEYDPAGGQCNFEQTQECVDSCLPLVPNACDCFGCCQVDGLFIYLDSNPECSMDNLGACNTCTYFYGCTNDCIKDDCELCFGETIDELPMGCAEPSCDVGTPCGEQSDCNDGDFCQTGCCVPIQG
jgi:cysteine-rich repeat protein